ncbi:MAG: leucine-rich repeat domain-containing protein [Muribaculaceae bacterium]|nr:leucine-rich repeat domain-containing protein [Muribaculaceae bacterium]
MNRIRRIILVCFAFVCWLKMLADPGAIFYWGHLGFSVISETEKTVSAFIPANRLKTTVNVKIPETVLSYTVIKVGGLDNCPELETVLVPKTVNDFTWESGLWPFSNNKNSPKLRAINIDPENPYFTSVDGVVYDKEVSTLLIAPGGKNTITIPDGVKTIAKNSFAYAENIENVYFSDTVERIEEYAFYRCHSRINLHLSNNLKYIGPYAFEYCDGLEELILPDSVSVIEDSAFFRCDNLKYVKLPSSLKVIDRHLFGWCISLSFVVIPEGVTEIISGAFMACKGLNTITIPASATLIDHWVFGGCNNLMTFIVSPENPKYSAEGGMLLSKDKKTLYCAPGGESVTIPEGVTHIDAEAFSGSDIAYISIPSTLTSIASWAFIECYDLKELTCKAEIPPVVTGNQGEFLSSDIMSPIMEIDLYVPGQSVELYKKADGWKRLKNRIYPIPGTESASVDSAVATNGSYTVYSLDGVLRLQTDNKDDIQRLPAGIYIVSGDGAAEKAVVR